MALALKSSTKKLVVVLASIPFVSGAICMILSIFTSVLPSSISEMSIFLFIIGGLAMSFAVGPQK